MHDVFVSYSSEDKATADAVVATLEQHQIRCWVAPRDVPPGKSYGASLVQAINGSRVLVLVFSSSANASPHVMREIERAASKSIPILPLRIEDVSYSDDMEYFISSTHWLDALTPPLQQHLERLARSVAALLGTDDGTPATDEERGPQEPVDGGAAPDVLAPKPARGSAPVAASWGGTQSLLLIRTLAATPAMSALAPSAPTDPSSSRQVPTKPSRSGTPRPPRHESRSARFRTRLPLSRSLD